MDTILTKFMQSDRKWLESHLKSGQRNDIAMTAEEKREHPKSRKQTHERARGSETKTN
jgi:hypothetical protein